MTGLVTDSFGAYRRVVHVAERLGSATFDLVAEVGRLTERARQTTTRLVTFSLNPSR